MAGWGQANTAGSDPDGPPTPHSCRSTTSSLSLPSPFSPSSLFAATFFAKPPLSLPYSFFFLSSSAIKSFGSGNKWRSLCFVSIPFFFPLQLPLVVFIQNRGGRRSLAAFNQAEDKLSSYPQILKRRRENPVSLSLFFSPTGQNLKGLFETFNPLNSYHHDN